MCKSTNFFDLIKDQGSDSLYLTLINTAHLCFNTEITISKNQLSSKSEYLKFKIINFRIRFNRKLL